MAMKPALLSETSASNMTWKKRDEIYYCHYYYYHYYMECFLIYSVKPLYKQIREMCTRIIQLRQLFYSYNFIT